MNVQVVSLGLLACVSAFLAVFVLTSFNQKSHLSHPSFKFSYLERIRQTKQHKQHIKECEKEFPDFLDVLVLGLSAGLSFDASLDLYSKHFNGVLADEFRQTQLSWQIGAVTRQDALYEMAQRLEIRPLENFAACVCEALEFGAPLSDSLENQAQLLRQNKKLSIEEDIEKVSVKMLIPLGTLIVPAMLIAILGPLLSNALRM